MKFVYLIKSLESSTYKIGVSKSPERRLIQIQTGNSEQLQMVAKYPSENYRQIESYFHRKYEYLNTVGEWFNFGLENELSFLNECKQVDENIKFLKSSGNEFI